MVSITLPVTGAGAAAGIPASGAACCWTGCDVPAFSSGLSLLQAAKPMIKTKLQHNEMNLYM